MFNSGTIVLCEVKRKSLNDWPLGFKSFSSKYNSAT
jgi:hypothetical protein